MTGRIDARLADLGITLPEAAAPAANYVPWVISGNLVFVSGQLPMADGKPGFIGKVGREFDTATGAEAAKACCIGILAQLKAALDGDLDRVVRCVKLGGFINAIPEFLEHPMVINGASDLMVGALGEAGRHSRFAVGVGSLPFGVAVEIDALFEIA